MIMPSCSWCWRHGLMLERLSRVSGGMRKLRWAGSGRGKRGGLRVIYYWWVAKDRISMLLVYPKNEMDDLTADQVKQLKNQMVL